MFPITTKLSLDVAAGASLGALTGLLVGLSSSPVVGTLVGSISTLLALFFGLAPLAGKSFDRAAKIRLASFATSSIGAVLIGIAIRSHSLLSPSLLTQLMDAGFTREEARMIIKARLDHDGIVVGKKLSAQRNRGAVSEKVSSDMIYQSTLMTGTADTCSATDPRDISRSSDAVAVWENMPKPWRAIVQLTKGTTEERRLRLLRAVWSLKCES